MASSSSQHVLHWQVRPSDGSYMMLITNLQLSDLPPFPPPGFRGRVVPVDGERRLTLEPMTISEVKAGRVLQRQHISQTTSRPLPESKKQQEISAPDQEG